MDEMKNFHGFLGLQSKSKSH